MIHKEEVIVAQNYEIEQLVRGKEKHYNESKLLKKVKKYGTNLGFKTLHSVATLYSALKSPTMPKQHKLMIAGVLGYFLLPIDVIADFLPMVGLTDDIIVITKAISVIYSSITDDMKQEGHDILKRMFGEKYQYSIEDE